MNLLKNKLFKISLRSHVNVWWEGLGGQEKSHQNSQVDGEEGSKKAKNTSVICGYSLNVFTLCLIV